MLTEFDVIFSDFAGELDALAEMARTPPDLGPGAPTPRARIAAGNGATLLLAATFEEYVRQQVRAVFREKSKHAKDMKDFPVKIAATVWRRSLESLARTPFEEVEADGRKTDARLAATLSFCLKKDITADVGEVLSRNDTNMRLQELGRLFNQIGVKEVIAKCCEDPDILEYLGADSAGKANALLETRFKEFFRRRNEIAHAIQLGSSSGPTELLNDIEMFRIFARALSTVVQAMAFTVVSPENRNAPAAI
jgi:hypothetical protein